MQNRVFFPQLAVDSWAMEGRAELLPDAVVLPPMGRRYSTVPAVRIRSEVTGTPCPHGLVNRVKLRSELEKLGAEIMDGSMVLGDNAYEVELGVLATPEGRFADYASRPNALPAQNDEELLAMVAAGKT
ncbi:MAG: hypothetical protein U0174_19745 [Polyangiaceae bacterium]